ncbi:MAG: nicotinate-nucleotide adenylyltransferase, partial [Clostridiales bacterium]|nr:nicotinate-nucleotide adenylyltransferase [Candidatus Blautia equi]
MLTEEKALRKKKIGIMGGTFDPIHIGHLILGEKTYEQLGLDLVYFMPSGNPPHKKQREGRASDDQRTDMVQLAIADNSHFELSLMEMHPDGYTYTYRTLQRLKEEHPDHEYYFIIGADSLFSFEYWMEPAKICENCTLVVAVRDHVSLQSMEEKISELSERFHASVILLNTENIDISSKTIRQWIQDGKTLKYYVPDEV